MRVSATPFSDPRQLDAIDEMIREQPNDIALRFGRACCLEELLCSRRFQWRCKRSRSFCTRTSVSRASTPSLATLLDAGFGMLATLIREKAAHAARVVVSVDPRYTSQTCAECAHVAKASREGAQFVCVSCGHRADADVNAARVILLRAELPPMRAPGTARGRLHDAA